MRHRLVHRGLLALGGTLLLALAAPTAWAQGFYINQKEVEEVLESHAGSLDALPEVYYDYYVLGLGEDSRIRALNKFYKIIGEGDAHRGQQRGKLVEFLNRTLMDLIDIGDTLVVPTEFELDFRAYSPFPRYYTGARDLDKLFVIDKSIQAFAAYEYGELARWGIVNTGAKDVSPTPAGRFNFNWRTEYRVSSLSPPGEPWEMYWVFNIHDARGIHLHQYAMPTGGPTSHGCVRLVDADARWLYEWADPWQTTAGHDGFGSSAGRIQRQGSTVIIVGEEPDGDPYPFELKAEVPVLKRVDLPADPLSVPPGSDQQRYFDRVRESE